MTAQPIRFIDPLAPSEPAGPREAEPESPAPFERPRLISSRDAPSAKLGARLRQAAPSQVVTAWLGAQDIPYRVLNNGAQVRIDELRINYYVNTSRIHIDGEPRARAETGFAELKRIIAEALDA